MNGFWTKIARKFNKQSPPSIEEQVRDRRKYNRRILNELSILIDAHPDLRFHQIINIFLVDKESRITYPSRLLGQESYATWKLLTNKLRKQ